MRLDKYLKVSRLIKRRTVANEACDAGRVLINDKPAKASAPKLEPKPDLQAAPAPPSSHLATRKALFILVSPVTQSGTGWAVWTHCHV